MARPRSTLRRIALFITFALAVFTGADPAAATTHRPVLTAPGAAAADGTVVVAVQSPIKATIRIQQRVGHRWVSLARSKRRTSHLSTYVTPSNAAVATLRALVRKRPSHSVHVQLGSAPDARDDTLTISSDSGVSLSDVTANDSDPDGGQLKIIDVASPAHGTAELDTGSGDVAYTPAPDYCNDDQVADSFAYTVIDPSGRTASASVAVHIECRASSPTPHETPQDNVAVGFNNNSVTDGVASPAVAAALLAQVGADIDRVQINWGNIEPAPGQYELDTYDAIYAADVAQGIKPLFIFAFAPDWASGGVCAGADGGCHAPPTPDHYADAAETTAMLAERYPDAAGIEIWNEPNTPTFWRPLPDPIGYTQLLIACHDAIKAVAPQMAVLGASTASGDYGEWGKIPARYFLEQMYRNGVAGHIDAISMHAYPDPGPDTAVAAVGAMRAVRDRYGDSSTPIWITEVGASTSGSSAMSEAQQASILTETDRLLRAIPGVDAVLFHTLIEPPRDPASDEPGFGIVTDGLRKKPAYCALAADWGKSSAC